MSDKQIALVTGASRGIGKAVALTLAASGFEVVGTATSPSGAQAISQYLAEGSFSGKGYALDVTELDSIENVLSAIKEDFGAPSVLVNNAAITRDNLMLRMKEEEWLDVVNTNLNSIFRMTKACLRSMVKARFGRIISMGSIVGSSPNPGQANYSATKAGVIGFSRSLAAEVASRGVTVNVVAPGFIDTDMTKKLSDEQRASLITHIPMGRIGQPEEIAQVVAFLASDSASYVTGQTIHANGGMLMP